ncbi:MAG: c-type cytochrome [Beijerinckiaceae bacterium]|nr:c-type cytochrome [Beijerinckiaceae bacterium]
MVTRTIAFLFMCTLGASSVWALESSNVPGTANEAAGPANVHQPSLADPTKSPSVSAPVSPVTGKAPTDVAADAPKGTIHNPYTGQADKIAAGKLAFQGNSCNGCHGGGGGGGICPSIKNDTWVYGSDDDTLFRLITLGSAGLQGMGYQRIGMENVVAPMPPFGSIIKSDDELFKIMAFIRSLYSGGASRINW